MYLHHVRRARMFIALSSVFVSLPFATQAGDVSGRVVDVAPGAAPELWTIQQLGTLNVGPGAQTLAIDSIWGVLKIDNGVVHTGDFVGVRLANNSSAQFRDATIESTSGYGLAFGDAGGDPEAGVASRAAVTGGVIRGAEAGVSMDAGGALDASGASISGTGADGVGVQIENGTVTLRDGSLVSGGLAGVRLGRLRVAGDLNDARNLIVDRSSIGGREGSGIIVDNAPGDFAPASISLANDSMVSGGNGTAIDVAGASQANIAVDHSTVGGNVTATSGGRATISAFNGALIEGAMNGDIAASLASAATWNVGDSSTITSLDVSGAQVAFMPSATPRTLTVQGDYAGSNATMSFNAELNAGGALSQQSTDRLLVEGNVTGTTVVKVVNRGTTGALTDSNQDGVIQPGEGISLIQVRGTSTPQAFVLNGGYVSGGPYVYTLQAFDATQLDPSQSLLGAGISWDYRLANRYVCEGRCDPEPPVGPTDPENPEPPGPSVPDPDPDPKPGERLAVVPQLPSYLSAPVALLSYGDAMNDGLHQRLGELRQSGAGGSLGSEMFARYLGGQYKYASNRSFEQYGYDFDQQINALQIGGSLLALDTDEGSLRAGVAADRGTTRVSPHAVDGVSSAKYRAMGVSAWLTWQHGSGFWVDGVVGSIRYTGDVATDLRGSNVARLRAAGWTGSIEAGLPVSLGGSWTIEPRLMLASQSVAFRDFSDVDGLSIHLGNASRTTTKAGVRIERAANPAFVPYARIDVSSTSGGTSRADVANVSFGNGATFSSGRSGNAYDVAGGVVSQLTPKLQVYGDGAYQHYTGGYGTHGWSANLGLRFIF